MRSDKAEYCARVVRLDAVRKVTPDAPASVTCPAPYWNTSITVPTGKATEAFSGTVMVTADAEVDSTTAPASVRASV